ncbi:alpha/beta fold hydrolase [Streptomyces luteolus]|uniref:Alpha/beta hydrolase n=1 Tax=Streptomyces luteolus TaxID=3043615 RepID=A0ABT6SQH1_9ACTN|nr:alpha/beta hydrolase [Streptomyces sp. B-S-A12]MDI3417853.1 alpha/beta hydrolase [Streptomyces sp. B-S-A12]
MASSAPRRSYLTLPGQRRLFWLEFGPADGRPLLALHGHLGEGAEFAPLAEALDTKALSAEALGADACSPQGAWRLIAPDQRGHGDSDRADRYDRAGYVDDLLALIAHLGLNPAVALGHSLGAVNACHLAAQAPETVRALVNVDGPAQLPVVEPPPLAILRGLPYTAPTREELRAACGELAPLLEPGFRPAGEGWRLGCHPEDMIDSDRHVLGDHWDQWLGTTHPALLVHGLRSQVLPTAQARAMVERRAHTTLVTFDCDHWVHIRKPEEFADAVRAFLAGTD